MLRSIFNICIISLLIATTACEKNTVPCIHDTPSSAIIPVKVDWSESELNPSEWRNTAEYGVHRLSLRFFPEDTNAPVFERYLEIDIYNGEVELPVGRYAVMAMNESVLDGYFEGSVTFTDTDNYALLAAELPTDGNLEATPPKPLAAWGLPQFEVTKNMATYTHGNSSMGDAYTHLTLSEYEEEQMVALTKIIMMPRTKSLNVKVTTENLGSARSISASVEGLSRRINMVSGKTELDPIRHTIPLDQWIYTTRAADDDGTASGSTLCFGHSTEYTAGHTMDLDVTLVDGTIHKEGVNDIDIDDQITTPATSRSYNIEHTLSLPLTEKGDINVDGWDESEKIPLN